MAGTGNRQNPALNRSKGYPLSAVSYAGSISSAYPGYPPSWGCPRGDHVPQLSQYLNKEKLTQARVSAIYHKEPRSELDSHADTCCVGDNALVLFYHNRTVSVALFLDSFGTADKIPIITAAIAYYDPITAQTYVIILHQALYFGDKLDHNLINPFQCRLNEVSINKCARSLMHRPDDGTCIPSYLLRNK